MSGLCGPMIEAKAHHMECCIGALRHRHLRPIGHEAELFIEPVSRFARGAPHQFRTVRLRVPDGNPHQQLPKPNPRTSDRTAMPLSRHAA